MVVKRFWAKGAVLFVILSVASMIFSHQSESSPFPVEPNSPRVPEDPIGAPPSRGEVPFADAAPSHETLTHPKSSIPTWTPLPQQGPPPPQQDPAIARPLVAPPSSPILMLGAFGMFLNFYLPHVFPPRSPWRIFRTLLPVAYWTTSWYTSLLGTWRGLNLFGSVDYIDCHERNYTVTERECLAVIYCY